MIDVLGSVSEKVRTNDGHIDIFCQVSIDESEIRTEHTDLLFGSGLLHFHFPMSVSQWTPCARGEKKTSS